MTSIEKLLTHLPDARPVGEGWSARCPAHDDNRASLSVAQGDDGRVLVKCHAGCETAAVVAAAGLTMPDLKPNRLGPAKGRGGPGRSRARTVYRTADKAMAELESRHGPQAAAWCYRNVVDEPVGWVVRWDRAVGTKDIRPLAWIEGGWVIGAMPHPRPLYHLPELATAPRVVVGEGEKVAEAARTLGLVATTSAGGAEAADQTDWSPLAGKEVILLPDNDPAGRRYADAVGRLLARLTPAPTVRRVDLPGLPPGGDLVDWIDAHGDAAEPDAMRAELVTLADAAPKPVATGPAAATGVRIVPELIELEKVRPVPVDWLWPGRIALGRITLVVGRPGAGKTFVDSSIAAVTSRGGAWPDGGSAPLGSTLLLNAEDDVSDPIVPRLLAAGANLTRVRVLKGARRFEPSGRETVLAIGLADIDLIRDALDRLPDCRLLVIDPVGSFLGGEVNADKGNQVRALLAPLALLAAERRVAVVLVCHNRKAGADSADDTVLGSRGFVGLARCVLHLLPAPGDRERKLLLPGKINIGRPAAGLALRIGGDPGRVEWEDAPLEAMHADDLMTAGNGVGRSGPAPEKLEEATAWLKARLRHGPVPVDDVLSQAKAEGLSARTVRRAKDELGVDAVKQTFRGGWAWALPSPDTADVGTTAEAKIAE